MASNVEVPSVGESVTEAILLKWYKQPGERVELDEPLCELETDKANVDVPAPAAGFFRPSVEEGATVEVGSVIAVLEDSADGIEGASAAAKPAEAPKEESSSKSAAPAGAAAGVNLNDYRPAVRTLLSEHGLDPSQIQGTGPSGALTKEDVEKHLAGGSAAPASAPAEKEPAKAPSSTASRPAPRKIELSEGGGGERREPMSKLRKRIATRLVSAQHETAMLTTFNEVDLTEVKLLRTKYKETFKEAHGIGLGFMSFFSKAASLALMEFPAVNAFIDGDDFLFHDYVNLGIAVSTDRGLVVPVIKGVERMSMWQIESEIKRVALAARTGKLGLNEMSGGTFTVTNGGVFGSLMSTPILNRPQSGILGMHTIQDRPVAVNGKVEIRPMMYIALSYDHRVIDGRESVSFLVRLKQYLEDPARMLLQV